MVKVISDDYGHLTLDDVYPCDNLKLQTVYGNIEINHQDYTDNYKISVKSDNIFVDATLFKYQFVFSCDNLCEYINYDLFTLYFDLLDRIVSFIKKLDPVSEPKVLSYNNSKREISDRMTYMLLTNRNRSWNGIVKTPQLFFYIRNNGKFDAFNTNTTNPVSLFYEIKNDILALYYDYKLSTSLKNIFHLLFHSEKLKYSPPTKIITGVKK